MNKVFVGNDAAYQQLQNYLNMERPGPLILSGKKGTGKRLAARELCRELLGCEDDRLEMQPDFYLLDKDGDSIKVDDVAAILKKSEIAALGNRKVFLILGADRMNEQAQNKLLKLLEDRNRTNTVIMLCEENVLLPTIQSRCLSIRFTSLPPDEMKDYLKGQGIGEEDLDLFGFLCNNCPYRAGEVREYFCSLRDTHRQILSIRERRELLSILHLVREKDPEEFCTVHNGHFDAALSMLHFTFLRLLEERCGILPKQARGTVPSFSGQYSTQEALLICASIGLHKTMYKNGIYSKNDFFDLARVMV